MVFLKAVAGEINGAATGAALVMLNNTCMLVIFIPSVTFTVTLYTPTVDKELVLLINPETELIVNLESFNTYVKISPSMSEALTCNKTFCE
jgi:hypothetical protein